MTESAGFERLSDAMLAHAWNEANRQLAQFSAQRARDEAMSSESDAEERGARGILHEIENETGRRALQRRLADAARNPQ